MRGCCSSALTHRSFSADHNERLEFLGDSVLNLAVSHLLYARLAALPEGDLSRVRANLVKQDTLHQLALKLALSPLLRLGEGEARSGGPSRPSILADALEALIGAVYLDAGYAAAAGAGAPAVRGGRDQSAHGRGRQGPEDRIAGMAAGPQNEAAGLPRGRHARARRTSRPSMSNARCPNWA